MSLGRRHLTPIYYHLKPKIPRRFQLALRRLLIKLQTVRVNNTWPIDESAKLAPPEWIGWPDNKRFALVLTHDVDTAAGMAKCQHLMDLEKMLGFRSSFNFVPRRYEISQDVLQRLDRNGFEIGVHGLYHDGNLFRTEQCFRARSEQINKYLEIWRSVGFRSPAMHHKLDWLGELDIEYDSSTFDTDPFEPQPEGVRTIFPFWVSENGGRKGYVELPYTLPQDFTLFVLMREKNVRIWKHKLDWIAQNGGMALLNTHPDYMAFQKGKCNLEEYPIDVYIDFLMHIKSNYSGQYWHVLPRALARFYKEEYLPSMPR